MQPRSSKRRRIAAKSFRAWPLVTAIALFFLAVPVPAQAGSNVYMIPPDFADPNNAAYLAALSDDANYAVYKWNDNLYRFDVTTKSSLPVNPAGIVASWYLWGPAPPYRNEGHGVSISKDGRYVAYTGSTGGPDNVYRRDMTAGTNVLVCANCKNPSISADGRYVAFESRSSSLPYPNGNFQVYRWDAKAAAGSNYKLISRALAGPIHGGNGHSFDPSISADGRFTSYTSAATDLVANDANGVQDVFVYDYNNVKTKRLSGFDPDGVEVSPAYDAYDSSINGNGQYVVFETRAALRPEDTNADIGSPQQWLSDIYIYDRWADRFTRVSMRGQGEEGQSKQGNGSSQPAISSDGGWIVFVSNDPCLADQNPIADCETTTVPDQIFMRDRVGGRTYLLSRNWNYDPANGSSTWPAVAKSGLMAGFSSLATDLDPADPNGTRDNAFLFDRKYAEIELNSQTKENRDPVTSGDGMVFTIVVKNNGPLSATGVVFSTLKVVAETGTPTNPVNDTSFEIMYGSSVFKNFASCTKSYVTGSTSKLTEMNCSGNFALDAIVAPGQSVSRQIAVRPYDNIEGKITMDVEIVNNKEADPTSGNNEATVYTRICGKGNTACLQSGPIDNVYPPQP